MNNTIKVNDYLTIKNVRYGKVVYFDGLNCEKGHISFIGTIKDKKIKGYQNIKTDDIYNLEVLQW